MRFDGIKEDEIPQDLPENECGDFIYEFDDEDDWDEPEDEEVQELTEPIDEKLSEAEEDDNWDFEDDEPQETADAAEELHVDQDIYKKHEQSESSVKTSETEKMDYADKVRDITKDYYEQAQEVARNNPEGRTFTDHKEAHVNMVADKSSETADAINASIQKGKLGKEYMQPSEERVSFETITDKKVLEGAALSHDTGMRGEGYVVEKGDDGKYTARQEDNSNFGEIRKNHSLNSAINVLADRDKYKEAGYSDEQVDTMAVECMAHSKSNSGVKDLNSKADWEDCFDKMDAAIEKYNEDHDENEISFNRSTFENDDKKLGELASGTLALRVGDVSRDSYEGAEAQSGENVNVDRTTIDSKGGSIEAELKDAKITIGDPPEEITNPISRQVHAGEQNIINNKTEVNDEGDVCHTITVDDGSFAPKCTQRAISDHLGELASAKDGQFEVYVDFEKPCDEDSKETYDRFRTDMEFNNNTINICYPWDKEE